MKLYLVRHAQAKSSEEDPERGLTEKGIESVGKVADFIRENMTISVSGIYHSGKKRARQTAEILAGSINSAGGVIRADNLAPMDDTSDWAYKLKDMDEDVALVGHLPYMSKLTSRLVCNNESQTLFNFTTAAMVCLGRDENGNWSVVWSITPEILKRHDR